MWKCFAWNVLDFFSLTVRTCQIDLLSLGKITRMLYKDVVVRGLSARSAKETVTEDVRAKASAETVVIPVVKIG